MPEDEAPYWEADVTYTTGMQVIDDHFIYEAVSENANRQPSISGNADVENAPWRTISVTNQWACLDIYTYTQTKAPEGDTTLTIKVPFDLPSTGFALLNMQATTVTVVLEDLNGNVVWESGENGLLADSQSWWDYWFGPFRFERDYVQTNLPPGSGYLTITLESGAGPAIGSIVVGERVDFGGTQYDTQSGFIDYSQIVTDNFGNTAWTQRKKARKGSYPVWFAPSDMDYIYSRIEELLGAPALWIGSDGVKNMNSLIIYGFLKEYEANVTGFSVVNANFEIQGII